MAEVYDLKGLNCPLPVLKARKRLAGLPAGSLLWIETTDPLAALDIPAFCLECGHRLLETEASGGGHRFLIERTREAADAGNFSERSGNLSRRPPLGKQ